MENQLCTAPQHRSHGRSPQSNPPHATPQRAGPNQNEDLYREQLCAVVLAASRFRSSSCGTVRTLSRQDEHSRWVRMVQCGSMWTWVASGDGEQDG